MFTFGLGIRYRATIKFWLGTREDLNLRPPGPEPGAPLPRWSFLPRNTADRPQEKFEDSSVEHQFANSKEMLGGGDRYKIDYTRVAVKSRCVAGIGYIA